MTCVDTNFTPVFIASNACICRCLFFSQRIGQIKESAWLLISQLDFVLELNFSFWEIWRWCQCVCAKIYSILIELWIISQHRKIVEAATTTRKKKPTNMKKKSSTTAKKKKTEKKAKVFEFNNALLFVFQFFFSLLLLLFRLLFLSSFVVRIVAALCECMGEILQGVRVRVCWCCMAHFIGIGYTYCEWNKFFVYSSDLCCAVCVAWYECACVPNQHVFECTQWKYVDHLQHYSGWHCVCVCVCMLGCVVCVYEHIHHKCSIWPTHTHTHISIGKQSPSHFCACACIWKKPRP